LVYFVTSACVPSVHYKLGLGICGDIKGKVLAYFKIPMCLISQHSQEETKKNYEKLLRFPACGMRMES
jgi:hypothetical protein